LKTTLDVSCTVQFQWAAVYYQARYRSKPPLTKCSLVYYLLSGLKQVKLFLTGATMYELLMFPMIKKEYEGLAL